MRVRPFYIAASIGGLIQLLFAAFSSLLAYFLVPTNLNVLQNLSPNVFGFTSVVGCVGAILAPIVHLAVGFLYAYLHWQVVPLTAEAGAIGGAASAAAARLVSGFFSIVIGILLTPILLNRFTGPMMPQMPSNDVQFFIFPMLFTAVGSLIGLCFGAVIAGAVGGLGGALGSLLINRQIRV